MTIQGNSLPERITRWDVLATNLEDDLDRMPQAAGDLRALQELIAETRSLASQQAELLSRLRSGATALQRLARQGDTLRGRLGATLRGYLGYGDATLVKYGFRPRPVIRRGPNKPKPAPLAARQP